MIAGVLTFDQSALPRGDDSFDAPQPDPIAARFVGKGLSLDGFVNPYVSEVVLQVSCAGPWCGSAQSGKEAVFFVPSSAPPVTLLAEPCGDMIFYDPTPATLEMLTSCMQGGACAPLPLE